MKTEKQVEEKIKKLVSDPDSFTGTGYDSDQIPYLVYSEISAEQTLRDFYKWLTNKEK